MALIAAVVLVAVALLGLAVYLLFLREEAPLTAQGSPSSLAEGGGVVVSEVDDVPQVHLYADYQCVYCAQLELTSGDDILEAAAQGRIALTVTTMSFLDGRSDTEVSSRAANAAQCADEQGAFAAYYPLPFEWDPSQSAPQWTDAQLIEMGTVAGVADSAAFAACVNEGRYLPYVSDQQERSQRDGVDGTPTVIVDGTPLGEDDLIRLLAEPGSAAEVLGVQR